RDACRLPARPPGGGGGHHHDPGPRERGARPAGGPDLALHPRRLPVPSRRRPADQLPSAPVVAPAPAGRLRGRALAGPLRLRLGRGLPVPLVRRRHARGSELAQMTLRLDIEAADGAARAATVTTARGSFSTPCFMPVGTRAAVRTLSSHDLASIGVEVALANTYHLMLRPGTDIVAGAGGLHAFWPWDGHLLTDSG